MAENKWSSEQQRVIDSRHDNLLVSAAAGSGKTAVLVEHIMGLVTDGGIDIDRLLIMTFTKAAAGEMRDRIRKMLSERSEKDPDNERLRRQQMLLHNASIMTIDSFCSSVVREFFHAVDLDPAFRTGQEAEIKLIEADTLAELLEDKYAEGGEDFLELVESLGNSKNDNGLAGAVMKVLEAADSHPEPEKWLMSIAEGSGREAADDDIRLILGNVVAILRSCILRAESLSAYAQTKPGLEATANLLADDASKYRMLVNAAESGYDSLAEECTGFKLRSLQKPKGDYDCEAYEEVKAKRDKIKACYKKALEAINSDTESIYAEYDTTGKLTRSLAMLTAEYMRRLAEAKRAKNLVSFSDLEHFTYEILTRRGENGRCAAAEELRQRYDRIFVDEYQDSNMIQECIVTAIADGSFGSPLTFMVGDVKQSIYRFRMAKPELFIERMNAYNTDTDKGLCINLHKNFRSRPEVLESTNDVFMMTMKACVGGITYDDECALNTDRARSEDPEQRYITEVIIADQVKAFGRADDASPEKNDDGGSNPEENFDEANETEQSLGKLIEIEARAVAKRIKELIRGGFAISTKEGSRPAGYGDIAVLMRYTKGNAEAFRAVFEEEGIPSVCETKAGFMETFEIRTVLDYLRILDNPRQDIPFTAVLYSPVCGLTAEELARIRVNTPSDIPMCEAARCYNAGDETEGRLKRFFAVYDELAAMNRTRDIDRLLGKLYDLTGFYTYCTAMPGGARRASNLELLIDYASDYEKSSFTGLFSFVRYAEQLKDQEVDLAEASGVDAGDAVSIMTIHHSKGLEYPIVFVSCLGKSLDDKDEKAAVIASSEYGIGVDYIDLELRVKSKSLRKIAMQRCMKKDFYGEELRLLYVAMTRAKDKLILTGSFKKTEEAFGRWVDNSALPDGMQYAEIMEAKSFLDFVCPAAIRSAGDFRLIFEGPDTLTAASAAESEDMDEKRRSYLESEFELSDEGMNRRYAYGYPHRDISVLPVKLSVSDLKRAAMEEEGEAAPEAICPESRDVVDADVQTTGVTGLAAAGSAETCGAAVGSAAAKTRAAGSFSAAQIGTLYHKILQLIPLSLADGLGQDLSAAMRETAGFLDSLVKRDIISLEESRVINRERLAKFLISPVCARMAAAAERRLLRREQPFVLGVRACDISSRYEGYEDIIPVQGVIDCLFEEDGELVVLDYKTDRIAPGEEQLLADRYRAQLEYYSEAAEKLLGRRVRERLIFSLALGKEIKL